MRLLFADDANGNCRVPTDLVAWIFNIFCVDGILPTCQPPQLRYTIEKFRNYTFSECLLRRSSGRVN
jgi:hypothetical protein